MNKEFVTYEQALALKELGFDEPCLAKHDLKHILLRVEECKSQENAQEFDYILAPLYQQAFRWFREKHKLESIVVPSGNSEGKTNGYYFEIIFDFSKDNIESDSYPSYEEAEQACLDKLIEICKNK
jgi:hypothetical protein